MLAKTLLSAGAAIVLIVACALATGLWQYRAATDVASARAFDSAQSAAGYVRDQQLRRLERASARIVDANFAARLAHALAADDAIGQHLDIAPIRELLEQRRRQANVNAIAVLDADGKYVTSAGDPFLAQHDLASLPLTVQSRQERRQTGAVLDDDVRVPLAAVTPVMADNELAALLVTATRMDAGSLNTIAGISDAALALVVFEPTGPSVVDSTLGARAAEQLQAFVDRNRARLTGAAAGDLTVAIDGASWSGRYWPVQSTARKAFVVALLPPARLDAIRSAIAPALIAAAAGTLLSVCAFLLIVWRRGLAPLAEMDRISERARHGDFALKVKPRGFAVVRRLAGLLNYLLSELDRHRVPQGAPRRRVTDIR